MNLYVCAIFVTKIKRTAEKKKKPCTLHMPHWNHKMHIYLIKRNQTVRVEFAIKHDKIGVISVSLAVLWISLSYAIYLIAIFRLFISVELDGNNICSLPCIDTKCVFFGCFLYDFIMIDIVYHKIYTHNMKLIKRILLMFVNYCHLII